MSDRKQRFSFVENFRMAPKKTSVKIALVGDGAVGKTSFFDRITTGDTVDYKFSKSYDATTGCNICQIEFSIEKYIVNVHLFDTAGQEKFGTLRDSYLMGVDGIIIMYDLNNKTTRQNVLTKWLPDIKRILIASDTNASIPVAVIGNKSDKIDAKVLKSDRLDVTTYRNILGIRKVTLNSNYNEHGDIEHFYASVKADDGLMDPINWLLKQILLYYLPVNVKKTVKNPIISRQN